MGSAVKSARRLLVGVLCLTAAADLAQAGPVYKSLDANGNVVYSDHLDSSMSQATVVQLEDPDALPHELHFCWTNCFTLILDNGTYRRIDGTDETWTVETFSPAAIVLHRHDAPADWNGYSQDVVYSGQVANDRLVGVKVNGKPTSGVDASWGSALNTLPGSNAERDATSTATPNSAPRAAVSTAATPPPPPEEDQPILSQDGYLWTPGYWYWRALRYVWIPGAWVRPPQAGLLWTPAYWSRAGAVFVFHPGQWGTTVGYYGGVNYGHGYFGTGYSGGHWIGNSFAYDSAVNRVNPTIAQHTYTQYVPPRRSPTQGSPTPGSRSAASIAGAPRAAAVPRAVSQTPSLPRPIDKPAATAPSPAAKSNHVIPSRAAPVKP